MSHSVFPSNIERLLWVMDCLRDPKTGCPWDVKQNFSSIVPYTIEEAYELADAIDSGKMEDIKDELGDLLFQVVFYAQLGKEQSEFDFDAIAKHLSDKMIRRHPHVFGNETITSDDELKQRWSELKALEKEPLQGRSQSILENIPAGLTPLIKADKIQKRCAKVGFDWPTVSHVFDKVIEEVDEIKQELSDAQSIDQSAVEEEVGDLLFAVVNLARHINVNAESALIKANNKFKTRFNMLEDQINNKNQEISKLALHELEKEWETAKKLSSIPKKLGGK